MDPPVSVTTPPIEAEFEVIAVAGLLSRTGGLGTMPSAKLMALTRSCSPLVVTLSQEAELPRRNPILIPPAVPLLLNMLVPAGMTKMP